jgi:REP element-mobilizing transposase RayT
VLSDPRIASLMQDAFLHFDGDRYRLLAWVVMPNHVHVVAEMLVDYALAAIVQSWKRHTARQANILLNRQGPLWQSDYYDRYVRNQRHYDQAVAYVHNNPVVAHLVERAEDWPWSSAKPGWQGHTSSTESQVTLL